MERMGEAGRGPESDSCILTDGRVKAGVFLSWPVVVGVESLSAAPTGGLGGRGRLWGREMRACQH